MRISQVIEELLPFWPYLKHSIRLRRRCDCEDILRKRAFSDYETLSRDVLNQRLKEERQRASAIDEKTFRLTLSLSVGLTVLGLMVAFLTEIVTFAALQTMLTVMIGVGLIYVLAAGLVAISALRTFPSYGYGSQFHLQQQDNTQRVLADALARQETMNNIRHLRNETAYQALRNGLLLLFAGIIVLTGTLVYQRFLPSSPEEAPAKAAERVIKELDDNPYRTIKLEGEVVANT